MSQARFQGGLAALLAASMLVLGCGTDGDGGPDDGPDVDELRSAKQRITDPQVPAGDMAQLAADNTDFAFDLYRTLAADAEGNLICSPFSVSIALAMTFAGTRTTTEAEFVDVLHFDLGQQKLHPAFNQLDLALASRERPVDEYAEDGFHLRVANSIWGQQGYPFEAAFLDTLAQNYGAGLNVLDYQADPEACRLTINDWVEDRTEDKIKDLIPEGAITTLTRLVLTNAIYFKAAWNSPFEEEHTAAGSFATPAGAVSAPMMFQQGDFFYAEGDGWQAAALPYDGEQLDMVVIVPAAGELESFEAALDREALDAILGALDLYIVDLTLPRFSFEFGRSLKTTLQAMGMTESFTFDSDFTGMTTAEELRIADVIHKAFIGVNEAGTEAAAATAVIMEGRGLPEYATLSVDRPFLFLIRDIPTGTILFVGRVLDPTA